MCIPHNQGAQRSTEGTILSEAADMSMFDVDRTGRPGVWRSHEENTSTLMRSYAAQMHPETRAHVRRSCAPDIPAALRTLPPARARVPASGEERHEC